MKPATAERGFMWNGMDISKSAADAGQLGAQCPVDIGYICACYGGQSGDSLKKYWDVSISKLFLHDFEDDNS